VAPAERERVMTEAEQAIQRREAATTAIMMQLLGEFDGDIAPAFKELARRFVKVTEQRDTLHKQIGGELP